VREHHPAVVASLRGGAAVAGPGLRSGRAANVLVVVGHRIPTKGPYRWKASRIEGSVALYGAAWKAVSATLSPKGPAGAPKRSQADDSKEAARAKARETEGKRGKRQGCQRLGPVGHRGKKTPTLVIKVGDGPGARRSRSGKRVRYDPPKRSERRETFVPPVMLRGA